MKLSIKAIFKRVSDIKKNIFFNSRTDLSYVVENKDWAVSYVGKKVVEGLKKAKFENARITTTALGIRGQIVHFGSLHSLVTEKGFKGVHSSNKIVLTWFHFVPEYKSNKNVFLLQERLKIVHTSCNITKQKIIDFGVDQGKIVMIPLGVDLNLFKPTFSDLKEKIRDTVGIPKGSLVIGSFQKDGNGWGEGLEPKLIKGPDVFVKVVRELSKDYPVFVLLVGPSRGYVKKELEKNNIAYKSIGYVENFNEVANYYKALDLYLVTSRIEGGPQAILESMASGVPLVSTKVGMAVDVIIDGENGFLAEVESISQIVQKAKLVIEDQALRERLVKNALETVKDYSWENINQRYLDEIYLKLIN
ncbi:MAG: glycosyltransferase family 4 protein [bacterium]|nr:glycosyltransferase family 4 protein [bacterium]